MQQIQRLGRVLATQGAQAWLWCDGQVVQGTLCGDARYGQFAVEGPGGWQPLEPAPLHEPSSDGDFYRLSERDATRYWALKARAAILRAIRDFFDRRGFCEVDPPMLASSPGLELHLDAVRAELRQGMGGAPTVRYLVTSPEYHCKRLLSGGFSKIYSLQHAFRSGERGHWHNPEFMMLEWYRVGTDYRTIVADCRALVRHCAKAIAGPQWAPLRALPGRGPAFDTHSKWRNVAIRRAISEFAGFDPGDCRSDGVVAKRAAQSGLEVQPGDTAADILTRAMVERVEPALRNLPAVVLERWPLAMASLSRPFADAPHWAERFEIYLHGVELANGFSELTDPIEQRRRFQVDLDARAKAGLPQYPVDERFLAALAQGMPPAAGVALGVDRLLMALLGLRDIDDVLAFPFERA